MQDLVKNLLYTPLADALTFLTQTTGNLGYAIVILTLALRLVLIPLTLPSLNMQKKMRLIQPELDALKAKHKGDKQALQQAQLALYQQHSINPASGCLPMILQFVILIAIYQVFINHLNGNVQSAAQFFWLDLTKPDPFYLMAILAGVTQFILSLMLLPAASTAAEKTLAQSTPTKKDDRDAQDMTEMAATMQKQMVFMMPVMTLIMSLNFPSGLTLYWIVTTLFSIVQQYFVSGWGGLTKYLPLSHQRQ
jgi:YidC/Oxa1 family membrane protein insertase